jgi:branched-chain amino acid transport system ATP-binding protein
MVVNAGTRGLADRVYVIDHGTIVFEGTPEALRADERVTATYLGVGR